MQEFLRENEFFLSEMLPLIFTKKIEDTYCILFTDFKATELYVYKKRTFLSVIVFSSLISDSF